MKCLEMDNGLGRGSFYAVLALYRRQAYIVIGVGLGLGTFSGWIHFDVAAILLFSSAILAWLFVTWLSMCYESFLTVKYPKYGASELGSGLVPVEFMSMREQSMCIGPSNYTTFRYTVTRVLAFFTVISFVYGLIAMLYGLLEI